MKELHVEEVRAFIDRVGAKLGYDHTYTPVFPEGRRDVCAVNRMVENGSSYGYNVVYLVWGESGSMACKEIADTRSTKDYLDIVEVRADGNTIAVRLRSGGSFSGESRDATVTACI